MRPTTCESKNAEFMKMKEFISEEKIPPYAILSHAWGDHEVTLMRWETAPLSHLQLDRSELDEGYRKILYCCQPASQDDLSWVWVGTCCIDKTSSTELSEAINSMFRWYKTTKKCYAYLADVHSPAEISNWCYDIKLRWFQRGWALQELLAPREIVFYSQDWHSLGTKFQLSKVLENATGIGEDFLKGRNVESASIAKGMFWASGRETSRVEDIAYCLIDILDINMPLL